MNSTMIKKIFFIQIFLMICNVSFAQSIKVIGNIPKTDTEKLYQLQVGAYRLAVNVNKASDILTKNGLVSQCEKAGNLIRVFVVVKAAEVRSVIELLDKAGFKEVVIREYAGPATTETKKSEDIPPVEEELLEEEILEELEEIAVIEENEEIEEIEENEEIEEIEEYETFDEIDFTTLYEIPVIETEEPEHDLIHLLED